MTDENKKGPSYLMSAIGGLFLGILASALLILFSDEKWINVVAPVFCTLAAIIGTYVAAEPYDELKVSYDKLMAEIAEVQKKGLILDVKPYVSLLTEIKEIIEQEVINLTNKAEKMGEDGLELAKTAEFLRGLWKKIDNFNDSK